MMAARNYPRSDDLIRLEVLRLYRLKYRPRFLAAHLGLTDLDVRLIKSRIIRDDIAASCPPEHERDVRRAYE